MIEIFLLSVFFILLIYYAAFLTIVNIGLGKIKNETKFGDSVQFVSIIIPFRNESENILNCLNSIINQDYPKEQYEIIFIDDSSTDDSLKKLISAAKPSNVFIYSMADSNIKKAFKKKAVSYGINKSKGEIIATTDADCIHGKNWLRKLVRQFDSQTALISGPVMFVPDEKIFSKIQSLEFAGLILVGAGLIGIGKPTICNGANLAFRRSVFIELDGYSSHQHLSSGEDELLMQKIASKNKYKIKFCWDKDAVVYTKPNKNLGEFLAQRKRWASKSLHYENKNLILHLIVLYLFYIGLLFQLILVFLLSKAFIISLFISLSVKIFIEFILLLNGSKLLFDRSLLKFLVMAEIFQIIYLLYAGLAGLFGNFKWKDRQLLR